MTASPRVIVEKPTLAYSVVELARASGVSESKVREAINGNRLIATLLEGKQVIEPEEAERWIKSAPRHDPRA